MVLGGGDPGRFLYNFFGCRCFPAAVCAIFSFVGDLQRFLSQIQSDSVRFLRLCRNIPFAFYPRSPGLISLHTAVNFAQKTRLLPSRGTAESSHCRHCQLLSVTIGYWPAPYGSAPFFLIKWRTCKGYPFFMTIYLESPLNSS